MAVCTKEEVVLLVLDFLQSERFERTANCFRVEAKSFLARVSENNNLKSLGIVLNEYVQLKAEQNERRSRTRKLAKQQLHGIQRVFAQIEAVAYDMVLLSQEISTNKVEKGNWSHFSSFVNAEQESPSQLNDWKCDQGALKHTPSTQVMNLYSHMASVQNQDSSLANVSPAIPHSSPNWVITQETNEPNLKQPKRFQDCEDRPMKRRKTPTPSRIATINPILQLHSNRPLWETNPHFPLDCFCDNHANSPNASVNSNGNVLEIGSPVWNQLEQLVDDTNFAENLTNIINDYIASGTDGDIATQVVSDTRTASLFDQALQTSHSDCTLPSLSSQNKDKQIQSSCHALSKPRTKIQHSPPEDQREILQNIDVDRFLASIHSTQSRESK